MNQLKRIRDFGLNPGLLRVGKRNLISDVPGVTVGHFTLRKDPDVRTGITVIDPGVQNLFRTKLAAAIAVGNGFGKLAGSTQVEELGTLETPIALSNTLAVGPVMRGIVDLVISNTPDLAPFETINAVVGETNDGILNAIHASSLKSEDVATAYEARSADFAIGSVGAGTGTRCFSWKGGIGSASRLIVDGDKTYTVGALVQTNFGGSLMVMGQPIGQLLGKSDFANFLPKTDGSCMIVLATDAPLTSLQLKRLARRGLLALARTGSVMAHGSGDYAIAFSTNTDKMENVPDDSLTQFFLAAVESVEESIYDALFTAETSTGRDGNTLEALPVEQVVDFIKKGQA